MESLEAGVFASGEKVYVPHTDKYYEAKILKAEYRGQTGWFYFLHYNGWNKKYDEWVEESGLVKAEVAEASGAVVPASQRAKKGSALGAGFGMGMGKPGGLGAGGPGGPMAGRARGVTVPSAPLATAPPVGLDLDMPPLLKKILVEDYEAVSEGGRLVPLPRTPCVADLLARYVQEAKELRAGTVDAEEEVAHGLQSYFDKALSACLLYRTERAQAQDALSDGRAPSAVYGAEHLTRLIVKLPDIMPLAALADEQLAVIATMVQDVMTWMTENYQSLFLPASQYTADMVQ